MKLGLFGLRFAAVVVAWLAASVQAAIITVTGTGDTIAFDGVVTLREAITSANNNADVNGDITAQRQGVYGTDTINFNIPGAGVKTIDVKGALPAITGPLFINGYTQGASSTNTLANADNAVLLIELNGVGAGAGAAGVGIAGLTLGSGSTGSIIRGLVINRFSGDGILVKSSSNTIAGNFIGVNPDGTATGPGNANTSFSLVTPFRAGVFVDNGADNLIGGTTPADRNLISGNVLDNIHIVGNAGAAGNAVRGNFIGVNATGSGILFNTGFFGIEVSGVNALGNTIGGTAAGSRNVIGGNADGIDLDDGARSNVVQGNFIGLGADGVTATANRLHGIVLRDLGGVPDVSGNFIGGTLAGAGNVVANNGSAGVAVFGDPSVTPQNVNNPILGNSIFNNGTSNPTSLLGIDLVSGTVYPTDDGTTPNDFGDGDTGPNKMQNYPVLTSVVIDGGTTTITGSLNSRNNNGAGMTYRIEFFQNAAASPTGFGEGQIFLGFKDVTIGANPGPFVDQGQDTVAFTADMPAIGSSDRVAATATELIAGSGSTPLNTSEFSPAIAQATPAPTPTPTPPTPTPPSKLANLATRAFVQTGDNVLIGGFIGVGSTPIRVIILAIGPSLSVAGVLADPILELHDGNGVLLETNDNWVDSPNKQEIIDSTLAPTDPLESAIVRTVDVPAGYTAIVRGVGDTNGIAVVQIFQLN